MEYLQHLLMRSLWVVLVVMLAVENGCDGCLEKERIALLQLKDSINYPNSISLPSWDQEDDNMDCCQWKGVECNSTTHRVIKLELYGARDYWRVGFWHLNASILLPFESLRSLNLSSNYLRSFVGNEGIGTLSNLHYLEELDLSRNYVDNSILPSLNKLSNLKILNLASNVLNGSISAKGIGILAELSNLEELDLSWNMLENGILPSLNKLSNLKILNLARNVLNGSISAKGIGILAELSNLEELDLSWNRLENSNIPSLNKLSNLKILNLAENELNGSISAKGMKMNYFQHLLMSSLWVVVILLAVLENGCNGCLEKERIALLQRKHSINFPNGTSLPSWEEDDTWTVAIGNVLSVIPLHVELSNFNSIVQEDIGAQSGI